MTEEEDNAFRQEVERLGKSRSKSKV